MADIESLTKSIGQELFSLTGRSWKEKMMALSIKNDDLRMRLLKFVDAYSVLKTRKQKAQRFKIAAPAIDLVMRKAAQHFIAGSTPENLMQAIQKLEKDGIHFNIDILGEAVLSEKEAEAYKMKYLTLMLNFAGLPEKNYSIKNSALYSQFGPIDFDGTVEAVKRRYGQVLRMARETASSLTCDAEQYQYRDLNLAIFMETLEEKEFRDFDKAGIAHQTYLIDSGESLRKIIDWAKGRKTPVTVRLVKGAYWDSEIIWARQKNWPIPVYTKKWQTDLSFERQVDLTLENYPTVKTAIGTHNIRSIARALAKARSLCLPKDALEIQLLWGMGNPLIKPILGVGKPYALAAYLTMGNLIEGMGYFARRIIENTAQNSFLRQTFGCNLTADELLRNPEEVK